MASQNVTLQMIADRCGLSKSTVAYVLREPDTCSATVKTKTLVLDTARQMGYHRNFAATALSTHRYRAIGFLLPWVFGHYGQLIMSFDKILKRRNYQGIYSFWENETFDKALETICNQGIDAIIALHYDSTLSQTGKPVVIYEDYSDTLDCVYCDKVDYIRQALDFITEAGYDKIGYIGTEADIRYDLLREELKRRALPLNPHWCCDTPDGATLEAGIDKMTQLLDGGDLPQVILAHSDLVAQGIIIAAKNRIAIPQQLGILSFDNLSWSAYMDPPLTTFDRNYDQTAELLIDTALTRLAHPDAPHIARPIKLSLVTRESILVQSPHP